MNRTEWDDNEFKKKEEEEEDAEEERIERDRGRTKSTVA